MIECNAAVLSARGQSVSLERITIAEPGADELVIKMSASGICRSQLEHIKNPETPLPLLLGHEGVGEVVAVGSNVTRFESGDTAIITWKSSQPLERQRRLNNVKLRDTPLNVQHIFTWSEYTVIHHSQAVRTNAKGVSDNFLGTLGCAFNTGGGALLNTVRAKTGDAILIIGAGGVGLPIIFTAREHQISPIIAIDVNESQLELARKLGATHTINARHDNAIQAVYDKVDFIFDTVATTETLDVALRCAKPAHNGSVGGTTVVTLGLNGLVSLDLPQLVKKQVKLVGSIGASNPAKDFEHYINLYKRTTLPIDEYCSTIYDFNEPAVRAACDDLEHNRYAGRAVFKF